MSEIEKLKAEILQMREDNALMMKDLQEENRVLLRQVHVVQAMLIASAENEGLKFGGSGMVRQKVFVTIDKK